MTKKEIKRNQKESSGMEDRKRKNNKSMIRVTGGGNHSGPEIIFNTLISENFPVKYKMRPSCTH